MAGYNEILEGRFNRASQRIFNMKGPASVNELASVIQPQISIHTDADQRFNESWESFGFILAGLSNAVNGSAVRVRNPTGSGVLALFTRIELQIAGGAAADFVVLEIGATVVDLTGAGTGIGRGLDTRTVRNTPLIITQNPAAGSAALGTAVSQYNFVAGVLNAETRRDFLDGFQRVVLLPGFAFQVRNATVNQNFQANFMWEERTLGDAEVK